MRWLFIFVLFLNFAYIAWEVSRPATNVYSGIPAVNNNVSPIVLLSEVSPQQPVAVPQNQPGNKAGDQQAASLKQEAAVQIDAGRAAAGRAKTGDPVKEQSGNSAIEVASLVQKGLPGQSQQPGDNCYTLGPFRDLGILRELTREIKPYVVAVDFRGSEVKQQTLYWVYLTPERNREAAIATGKRLKESQINDYFIIRDGEKVNGISLGYYRNKAGATALANRAKQLGFDVVLESVYKTHTVYWLDYQLGSDVQLPGNIFDKYIKAQNKDSVKRLDRDCSS